MAEKSPQARRARAAARRQQYGWDPDPDYSNSPARPPTAIRRLRTATRRAIVLTTYATATAALIWVLVAIDSINPPRPVIGVTALVGFLVWMLCNYWLIDKFSYKDQP